MAFADGKPTSLPAKQPGVFVRNSPGLLNAVFQRSFFYDHRAKTLEEQVDHVIYNPDEFNSSYQEILRKITEKENYRMAFDQAFPDQKPAVQVRNIQRALAAYVASLNSFQAPFDRYMRGDEKAISEEAKRGYNLFTGKAQCATCHFPPLFNGTIPPKYRDTESEVLGLTLGLDTLHPVLDHDPGRFLLQPNPVLKGAFKTPGLRNLSKTKPYMHNGKFKSLEDVVEFYNRGGGAGMGLDVPNQTLPPDKLGLTPAEVRDVVAFLHSLDEEAKK